MDNGAPKDSLVICQNSQGVEIRASLMRLTRYVAVFEVYNPGLVLRVSEVLGEVRIILNERAIYSGRAVVTSLVNAGTVVVCEAKLDEAGFMTASFSPGHDSTSVKEGFRAFLSHWQKLYKVLPEFKVVVADMQTFLADLRLWLEQVELEIRSAPSGTGRKWNSRRRMKLAAPWSRLLTRCTNGWRAFRQGIEEELRPVHQNFSRAAVASAGHVLALRVSHLPQTARLCGRL